MSGRKNNNTSETFGKFTATGSSATKRTDGPENITPDMWAPISAGKAPEVKRTTSKKTGTGQKSSPERAKKKSAPVKKKPVAEQKKPDKAAPPISEGRRGEAPKTNSAPKKKTKSRASKGRPVSELAAEADKKLAKVKQQRDNRNRKKADEHSDRQLKGGMAPGEVSKHRAKTKKKKRIWRNVAAIVMFITFVAVFLGVYIHEKGAPIASIVIEGDSIYSKRQIIAASGIEKGSNMFAVSEDEVNSLVCSELPYIHSVSVRTKLPDSIIVTVSPSTDRLLIVNGKQYICVDGYNRVVSHEVKDLEEGSYRIKGFEKQSCEIGAEYLPSENNAVKFEMVQKIVSEAEKHEELKKGVINIADTRNVRFYCNGVMIYLGSCYDIERQISDSASVLKTQFAEGETGYINVKTKVPAFQKGNIKAD